MERLLGRPLIGVPDSAAVSIDDLAVDVAAADTVVRDAALFDASPLFLEPKKERK
jgi:hypothetical protein